LGFEQLQFFEYQANTHLAHLLPEKGNLGERLPPKKTQRMEKTGDQQAKEKLLCGFSHVSTGIQTCKL